MRKITWMIPLFFLLTNLAACSTYAFVGGHFITNGRTVSIPYNSQAPNAPKEPFKCYTHQGRAGTCTFPYHISRAAAELSPVLLLILFPVSVALDIAFLPIAFFWGIESGAEHWSEDETPRPTNREKEKKKQEKE